MHDKKSNIYFYMCSVPDLNTQVSKTAALDVSLNMYFTEYVEASLHAYLASS
jgi:hypothetical protein